jgi:hypothetical protein
MYLQQIKGTSSKDKKVTMVNKSNVLAKEVDYDLFYTQFWVKNNIQFYGKNN